MSPRRSCEKALRFRLPVGSSSNDLDLIGDPSDALNVDRYNSFDGRFGSIHLSSFLTTCVI